MRFAYFPKPHDLLAVALVVPVSGITFPIIYVDFLHTTEHQLELAFVKILQPWQRNDVIDAVEEGSRLLLHSTRETPVDHQAVNLEESD